MYVLIRANVDHENESAVVLVAASDSLDEVRKRMVDEWEGEMASPSPWFVDAWDDLYSGVQEVEAECGTETAEWSVHWYIFDTDNIDENSGPQGFYFI